jgi:transcription antitermination factor NusG
LLEGKSVEIFLPMYESVHRWNDRNALVSQPIFPGYLFVRIGLADRMWILSTPGVVNFVGAHDRPCPIPDDELAALRVCWEHQLRIEPHPYLVVGRRVRVKKGLLAETEGILVRKKGQFRLVLSVNLITRSIAVEVDAHDVVPAEGPRRRSPVD